MLFNPMYFARQALWFWSVMFDAMVSDALSGKKPQLVLIVGGKR